MISIVRPSPAIVLAILVAAIGAFGYDAPLSDEAVREAYFLGQRRDETTAHFLEAYRRYFHSGRRALLSRFYDGHNNNEINPPTIALSNG